MPFRLVTFLAFIVLVALFLGFNLENRCDVSVVFRTFSDVPIAISLLFAYAAGVVSVIPILLGSHRRKNQQRSARERRAMEKAAAASRKGADSSASRKASSASRKAGAGNRDDDDSREYGID